MKQTRREILMLSVSMWPTAAFERARQTRHTWSEQSLSKHELVTIGVFQSIGQREKQSFLYKPLETLQDPLIWVCSLSQLLKCVLPPAL